MKFPERLNRFGDWINPIVIKELRQAVQSRFLIFSLMALFILEIVGLTMFVIFQDTTSSYSDSESLQAGRGTFLALQYILMAVCLLFLPINAAVRLAAERSDENTDLMYITTLSPSKIIIGKMVAALVIALMIFSACLPYMVFTYFLKGIDLPVIVLVVIIDFLVVVAAVQLCVFLAAVSRSRIVKGFLSLVGLAFLISVYGYTVGGTTVMVYEMPSSFIRQREFWLVVLGSAMTLLVYLGLLFTWSVAVISPPSSNRTLGTRIFVFAVIVLTGGVAGYWSYQESLFSGAAPFVLIPLIIWYWCVTTLLGFTLLMAFHERESWGPRIARTIPKNILLRIPAFLFYNGSAGGVFYSCLLLCACTVGLLAWQQYVLGSSIVPTSRYEPTLELFIRPASIIFLYLYAYGMTAVFVRRTLLRRIPAVFTWAIILFLLVIFCLTPLFISYAIYTIDRSTGFYWDYEANFGWFLTHPWVAAVESNWNVFRQGNASERASYFTFFVVSWSLLVTVVNLPWLSKQLRNFQPYIPETKEKAVALEATESELKPGLASIS